MKKFKLSLAGLALIAMASAFTVKSNSFTEYWVQGNPDGNGDFTVTEIPVEGCLTTGSTACKIESSVAPVLGKISQDDAEVIGLKN